MFEDCNFEIPEYKDRGILLKDILEESTASCALGIRAKSKCVRVGGNKSPFYSKHFNWLAIFLSLANLGTLFCSPNFPLDFI